MYAFLQSVLKKSIPFWNFDVDWFVDFEEKKLQKACQYSRSLRGNKTPSYWSFIKYAYCDAQNSTHVLNLISQRGSDCLVASVSIKIIYQSFLYIYHFLRYALVR